MAGKEPLSHLDRRLYFSQFGLISPTSVLSPPIPPPPILPPPICLFYLSAPSLPPLEDVPVGFQHTPFSLILSSPLFITRVHQGFALPSSTQRETSLAQLSCLALSAPIVSTMIFDVELSVD